MTGLTRSLASFVSQLQPDALPPQAAPTVLRGLADCLGVLLAGRDEPVARIASESIMHTPGPGSAPLLGDRGQAAAADAAFVNATAAHALDYDDTGLDGHPSVILVPVMLAAGLVHRVDGARAIAAYVAGYETWAELIGRDADKHHGKGWHPTAVFGTVAAAAAGASLARLDAERTAHALGIAASMAAGVIANFGSMTKPLQAGFAVRNGLHAVRLAALGATASADALEHPRGLLAAVSPAGRTRLDGPAQAGAPWQIVRQGLNIKRYPVCYAAHRAIDAALSVRGAVGPRLDAIERIDVSIGTLQAAMLRNPRPATVLDAKFSAEFAIAAALDRGAVGLAELDDRYLASPSVQALIPKVHVQPDTARDSEDPLFSPADQVRVTMRDGRRIDSAPVQRAEGHADRPLREEALRAKFLDCATPALGAGRADRWWQAIRRFEAIGPAGIAALADPDAR